MAKSKTTTKPADDTVTLKPSDLRAILDLFNTVDSVLDDVMETCDLNLSDIRRIRETLYPVSSKLNFRPQVDEGGTCRPWLPKVLATDDNAWFNSEA
jgi:hypothetical protein